jgi:hypothetical protein
MGGMIAVEVAKIVPLDKAILISSIRTIDEAPGYFRLFRMLPVYKIIPGKLFTSMGFMLKPMFGKMSEADLRLFKDMLKNTSPVFVKWAMAAILNWDNKIIPPNIVQITGDKDTLFPYKKLKEAIIVKGGTHIMIFDKAKEINQMLKKIIKNEVSRNLLSQ